LSRDRLCGGTVFAEGAALHRQRRSLANDGPSPERFPRQRGSLVNTSLLEDGPYPKTLPTQRRSLLKDGSSPERLPPQRRSLLKDGPSPKRFPLQRRSLFKDVPSPKTFPLQRWSLFKDGPSSKTFPPQRRSLFKDGPSSKMVPLQRRSLPKDGPSSKTGGKTLAAALPDAATGSDGLFSNCVNYRWPPSLDGSAGRQGEPLADTRPKLCVSSDVFVVIQIFRWLQRRNPNQKQIFGCRNPRKTTTKTVVNIRLATSQFVPRKRSTWVAVRPKKGKRRLATEKEAKNASKNVRRNSEAKCQMSWSKVENNRLGRLKEHLGISWTLHALASFLAAVFR